MFPCAQWRVPICQAPKREVRHTGAAGERPGMLPGRERGDVIHYEMLTQPSDGEKVRTDLAEVWKEMIRLVVLWMMVAAMSDAITIVEMEWVKMLLCVARVDVRERVQHQKRRDALWTTET